MRRRAPPRSREQSRFRGSSLCWAHVYPITNPPIHSRTARVGSFINEAPFVPLLGYPHYAQMRDRICSVFPSRISPAQHPPANLTRTSSTLDNCCLNALRTNFFRHQVIVYQSLDWPPAFPTRRPPSPKILSFYKRRPAFRELRRDPRCPAREPSP